ncbi:hypothetical protein [Actinosynnema sp. NPDC020468]|uniref:hypothetical protein n=1 Tax=Actinosynnema sp. NPDC020468 TaxID=3154488 RepID=UPI0033E2B9FB
MSQQQGQPPRPRTLEKIGAIAGVATALVVLLSLASGRDFWPFHSSPALAAVVGALLLLFCFFGHLRLNGDGKPTVAAALSLAATLGASLVVGAVAAGGHEPGNRNSAADLPIDTTTVVATTTTSTTTPTSTSRQTTTVTTTTAAGPYGEKERYRLTVSPTSYVDLDSRKASLEGGPEYEFRYPGDINHEIRFAPEPAVYGESKVSLVDPEGADPQKCDSSTRPQKNSVSGYMLDGAIICFTTSEDRLAIITVQSFGKGNSWDGIFDVVLYERSPS